MSEAQAWTKRPLACSEATGTWTPARNACACQARGAAFPSCPCASPPCRVAGDVCPSLSPPSLCPPRTSEAPNQLLSSCFTLSASWSSDSSSCVPRVDTDTSACQARTMGWGVPWGCGGVWAEQQARRSTRVSWALPCLQSAVLVAISARPAHLSGGCVGRRDRGREAAVVDEPLLGAVEVQDGLWAGRAGRLEVDAGRPHARLGLGGRRLHACIIAAAAVSVLATPHLLGTATPSSLRLPGPLGGLCRTLAATGVLAQPQPRG